MFVNLWRKCNISFWGISNDSFIRISSFSFRINADICVRRNFNSSELSQRRCCSSFRTGASFWFCSSGEMRTFCHEGGTNLPRGGHVPPVPPPCARHCWYPYIVFRGMCNRVARFFYFGTQHVLIAAVWRANYFLVRQPICQTVFTRVADLWTSLRS